MPERLEIYIVYKRRYINTLPFPFPSLSSPLPFPFIPFPLPSGFFSFPLQPVPFPSFPLSPSPFQQSSGGTETCGSFVRFITVRSYASAIHAVVVCPSVYVYPSVCLSQAGTVPKRLNVESYKQLHMIAHGL